MHEYIGSVKLNLDSYGGTDLYSDGAVEDELLDIVQNFSPEQYNQVIAERKKWPIMYHLSKQRQNILKGVEISKEETVLEIGSGCGAITGILAQHAASVTCIELSKKRSQINAYQNQDKDNIEILIGNFQDIEKKLTEKYDIITLIGVFEYAQSYIAAKEPFLTFLKMIKAHLKESGRIIIAIENKFGLKYFAGCREDHVNNYFAGLEGYPNTDRARTFGKSELAGLLESSGFAHTSFYYPYPDYKFPNVIYSDEYLPKRGELKHNLRNFDDSRMYLFHEDMVYDSIVKEDMFPFFSNSYLVVAGGE